MAMQHVGLRGPGHLKINPSCLNPLLYEFYLNQDSTDLIQLGLYTLCFKLLPYVVGFNFYLGIQNNDIFFLKSFSTLKQKEMRISRIFKISIFLSFKFY